ncbi:MAG: multifunctional CCA addition/repair protein [Rhodoferax sp.]|nr:multifunctional CCA addition/repair protein [Rhodoferax sp.]
MPATAPGSPPLTGTFLVGGAVRDALMGLTSKDRDWVVVGSSPQHMVDAGFTPVGKDFPVFLHPLTHEEYALARTERKTGPGYRGFEVHAAPQVTLEEDLARRDLTINAMAARVDPTGAIGLLDGHDLIDPFGGAADLGARVLRHVTPAFREDPVRILRVARFAARFSDFTLAPETQALMRSMVKDGEVDHLVPERVWQEIAKGLMEPRPSRMLEVLRNCGALARLVPELDRLWGVPQSAEHHPEIDTGVHVMMALDRAAALHAPLDVRFACLTHDLGKGTTPADVLPRHLGHEGRSVRLLNPLCQRLRVPKDCAELAEVVAREHGNIHRSGTLDAAAVLRLLERCDALRKPLRFMRALQACQCDAQGRLGLHEAPYPQALRLAQALELALAVETEAVAAQAMARGAKGMQIGQAVHAARAHAIAAAWQATRAE